MMAQQMDNRSCSFLHLHERYSNSLDTYIWSLLEYRLLDDSSLLEITFLASQETIQRHSERVPRAIEEVSLHLPPCTTHSDGE